MLWVLLSRAERWLRQEKRPQCGPALLLHCQSAMGAGRTLCEAGGQMYIIANVLYIITTCIMMYINVHHYNVPTFSVL